MLNVQNMKDWEEKKVHVNKGDIVKFEKLITHKTNWDDLTVFFKEVLEKDINIVVDDEQWIDKDFIIKFIKTDKIMFSEKVSKGMENTTKAIGRPNKTKAVAKAIEMYQSGNFTLEQIENATGISKTTLYRNMKKMNIPY